MARRFTEPRLVVASHNEGKAREIADLLVPRGFSTLSAAELAALPVLCRGAALRFLLTRLYDWLTVPDDSFVTKKDPMEYLGKLRFHRSVKSVSDYGYDDERVTA